MSAKKINAWQGFWIILVKEVVDNLRDKRTLNTIAFSVILGPLIIFGIIWFQEKTVKEETDLVNGNTIVVPVVGAELAPNLINWLVQNNVEVVDPPSDPEQAISDGEYRMVLVITDSFANAWQSGKAAPVRLVHNSALSPLEKIGFHTVSRAIQSYGAKVASMRLQARGISPELMRPITVNVSDVAPPSARNAEILSILPYIIIMFIMAGGMYLAIDTTAGERENGSLEPLLAQPVPRRTILLAKLGATTVFSAVTLLAMLIGLSLAFAYMPIDAISVSMGWQKILMIFIGCLPFALLGSALMVLVASFTRSTKEAQSYLGMVMLVPSLPLIMLTFMSPIPSVGNMWIPSLSQGLIIIETLKGGVLAMPLLALSMICTLLVAALLAFISTKLYERESILG
jgi:sodium transport system permease protein